MPEGGGPGANDPFNQNDLADVLDRVVMPVVNSIIKPEELERVDLGWGPRLPPDDEDEPDRQLLEAVHGIETGYGLLDSSNDLCVLVAAKGNQFEWPIWKQESAEPNDTLGGIAFGFADVLEDFVFDCVVCWGDLRIAKYTIPGRKLPAS